MKSVFLIFLGMLFSFSMAIFSTDYVMLSELGTSAKSIGIGTIQGFDYSSNSVFENPAGLATSTGLSVSAFSTSIINEFNVTCLSTSYAHSLGVFSVGYLQGIVKDIFSTRLEDNRFYVADQFDYRDETFKFGYAMSLEDRFSLGGSLGYYKKSFGSISGQGFGMDLGVKCPLFDFGDLSFIVRNLLSTPVSYSNSQSETLPMQFVLSTSIPVSDFTVYSQIKNQAGKPIIYSLGASTSILGLSFLELYGGYKQFWVLDEVNSGLTMGASLNFNQFKMNYSFEKGNYFEDSAMHYISFEIGFDFLDRNQLELL